MNQPPPPPPPINDQPNAPPPTSINNQPPPPPPMNNIQSKPSVSTTTINKSNQSKPPPPPPSSSSINNNQTPPLPPPPIPVVDETTSPLKDKQQVVTTIKPSLSSKVIDMQVKMTTKALLTGRTKSQLGKDLRTEAAKDANPFGRGSSLNERPKDEFVASDAGFSNNDNIDEIVYNDNVYRPNTTALNTTQTKPTRNRSILQPDESNNVIENDDITKKLEIEEPKDINIYNKLHFPVEWLCIAIIIHFIQFGILLDLARDVLTKKTYYLLLFLVIVIGLLLLAARFTVKKKPLSKLLFFMEKLKPEDEVDGITDATLIILATASILEGFVFALFCSFCGGKTESSSDTAIAKISLLSALQYSSITFLAFHRIVRPSNRCDPLRTMMELDVVNVCWDALDGSTFFQLLEGSNNYSYAMDMSIRFLMSFWYISVGFRVGIMHLALCSPGSLINRLILTPVLSLSHVPTVDRTLQGLRFRSMIVITMTFAEVYAIIVRVTLWIKGKLDTLQQEMAIKNIIFLCNIYGAYDMFQSTKYHNWNTRDLGIGYNLKLPRRHTQMKFFKYTFAISYLLEGSLLGSVLVKSSSKSNRWLINVFIDLILVIFFLLYCRKCYNHRVQQSRFWLLPQKHFVIFPYYLAVVISILMAGNLFIVRLPYIYYEYNNLEEAAAEGSVWNYNFSLIVISVLTVVNLYTFSKFWSISIMLFNKKFTACPGDYQAIHDPTIVMVGQASMLEGAMDVLSTATLLSLASYDLPPSVNGAIVMFSLLELFNACQSFVIQVKLSNGNEDTPLDLVKWYSYLRCLRGVIDFGAFVLRVYVWYNFGAISSVFIIKNLYNLLHTAANFSNMIAARKYDSKTTLFTEYVSPYIWYGLTAKDWKNLTPLEY